MRASLLALVAVVAGCTGNTAPGNDREAALDPPAEPAALASAAEATAGVSPGILYPQIITDPDRARLPEGAGGCLFRYTRVGFPAFAYGAGTGVVKLNGKLIPLPAAGAGRYSDGPVTVSVRPLDDEEEGPFEAELVFRMAGEPDELGFHGYGECGAG